jgi:tetratricopeptide (TPR) repeat protein
LSYFEHKELEYARKLIEKGSLREGNQILNDFRENKDISHDDLTLYYILKVSIYTKLGYREEIFDWINKACSAIQGQEESLQKLDVYIVKAISLASKFKFEKALEIFLKSAILKS